MYGTDLVFLHSNHDPECRARVDKHFDGYWTLQFGESGGVELFYGEERHLLDDGAAWFWTAFPGPRIRFHAAPGRSAWAHRYAAFQGPRARRWVEDGLFPTAPQQAPGRAADYAGRFDALLSLLQGRADRWSHARAVNLLEAFLLEMAAARESPAESEASPLRDLLRAVEAFADENGDGDYAALAHARGMSVSTLRRHFLEAAGVPLHTFVIRRRLARARSLLGETDLPIKEIAARLGYADVYFFTRQFRCHTGVPPAAYRRSRQSL
jgi:AraC-type DNA-binding domain-containing proteins